MEYSITLLEGDGIGPEIAESVQKVLNSTGVDFKWNICEAGERAIENYGTPLPDETINSIKNDKIVLKGPIATPIGKGFKSINVELRQKLGLYANYRPVKSLSAVKSRYQDIDLIVIRENTEGLYSGIEHEVVPGVIESLKIITAKASQRIAKYAFETARKYNRKQVTAVHKANIMKMSDGLFLEECRRISKDYPEIEYNESIVDATAMKLVVNPSQFDILVMENLYGDILSDLTAGLIGGLGLAPSANISDEYAVFEAVHGSAPDIAGKNIANPTALILSGVLLLRYIGRLNEADKVYNSVENVLKKGIKTQDLGGNATTSDFTIEIIKEIKKM